MKFINGRNLTALALDLTKLMRSVWDKTEIDKHTHHWQIEGDERVTVGIGDCPCVLCIGTVGHSVLGVFCLEFLRAELLDE